MTARTRSELNSDADSALADNSVRAISAEHVRQRVKDLADSALLPEDVGSAAFKNITVTTAFPSNGVNGDLWLSLPYGGTWAKINGIWTKMVDPGQPVRFGFVTDLHNADRDVNGNRYYRDVLAKIADAIALFNSRPLDFIFLNGDIIDGYGGLGASTIDLDGVKSAFLSAKAPRVWAAGNHDYQPFTLSQFAALTGMDAAGYYCFDIGPYRFVILDANYEADDDDSHYAAGGFSYSDTYIPPTQRAWLTAILASAPGKCVIFCHQRLELQVGANYAKNADAVRSIIDNAGNVLAVIMGHAHTNSLTYINGIPYVVAQALIEGAHPLNSYLIGTVENNVVSIEGFGQQTDWGELNLPEYETLVSRFASPASPGLKGVIYNAMRELKNAGLLDKLDYLRVALHTEQASCQNWIEDRYNATLIGSPAFTPYAGFEGDGDGSGVGSVALDTGFNPLTAGGMFQQDSATFGVFVADSPNPTTGSAFNYAGGNGTTGSGATFIRPLNTSSTATVRLNSAATATVNLDVAYRSRLGLKAISRSNATEIEAYADGVKQGSTISNNSDAPANTTIRELRAGAAGSTYGQDTVFATFFGAAFDATDHANMSTILHDLKDALDGL